MPTRPPTYSPPQVQGVQRHVSKQEAEQANRQATRALNTNSLEWKRIRAWVLLRDGHRCQACGRLVVGRQAHVDHKDGDNAHNPPDGSNWQTLCAQGHSRKTWAEQHGKAWDRQCEGTQAVSAKQWTSTR